MANINIKTNFVDGEKLFAQQLNNNFKTIQEGMNADNKIIWQDGEEVLFKRYVTNDIESLPILDGSIIYDVEKGRHYIDYNGARIQVGSAGKEVLVQDNEPTEEDNKIWIDTDFVNTMGTEVVDSLDGDETNMAPSVRAVKKGLLDSYSEEEQVIGTWIDGKPLYRQVYQFTTPSTENSWESMGQTGANIETVVDFRGTVLETGQRKYNSINFGEGSYYIHTAVNAGNNRTIMMMQKGWSSLPCVIIIEYTKTTDSEVISDEV